MAEQLVNVHDLVGRCPFCNESKVISRQMVFVDHARISRRACAFP